MDHTISDMYYLQLPIGGPTQADIWLDLPSWGDAAEFCNGLIITPRCDFAHSKSPVLNYLPIVDLESYVLSVACFSHLERAIADAADSLRAKAAPLNVDQLFELGFPLDEIRKLVVSGDATSDPSRQKQIDRAKNDFEVAFKKIDELNALLKQPRLSWEELISALNHKRLASIQRDLIKNNNVDTYFLPPCEGLLERPSLVLLRHIYTCPISVVGAVNSRASTTRSASEPVARQPQRLLRLKSPFIESLMAKFAALFTRVGTRDIPDPVVQNFFISSNRN